MPDRHFIYLDAPWVREQLEQLEALAQIERERTGGGGAAGVNLPGVTVGGGHSREIEIERLRAADSPERMFAHYHDHLSRGGRLSRFGPLVPSRIYELEGEITEPDGFVTEEGLEVTLELNDAFRRRIIRAGMKLKVFGLCVQVSVIRVMAIYMPEYGPVQQTAQGIDRRKVLMGLGGAGVLAAGGVAGWQALQPRTPARTVYRIAGGPQEFFADEEVKELFAAEGLTIQHTQFGSGELRHIDLSRYDGVFPASAIMARYVQGVVGNRGQFPSFGSPMVVMSWDSVIEVLADREIARQEHGIWVFDVGLYLNHVHANTLWPKEAGVGVQRMLLRTTDPSTSNSAAMFIAVASYVLNGNNIVTDAEGVADVLPRLRPCFTQQGHMQETTGFLRGDYFDGPGKIPMCWVYEDDVLDELIAGRHREIRYLYPTPNIFSDHYFVPVNDHPDGERIGRLLRDDQRFIRIAQQRYGNRYGTGNQDFVETLQSKNITVPDDTVLNILVRAGIPSADILGSFIDAVEPQRKSPA